jgi:hypothetical protein
LNNLPIYIYAILVSLIASTYIAVRYSIPKYLKLFPVFLFLTLVVELFGTFTTNNAPLYNFFSIVEFVFYLFIIKRILITRIIRFWITVVMIFYPIGCIINIFLIQKSIYRLHVTTYSIGCLIVVIFSIFYFYELFRSTNSVNLKREPAFWIITGLLFFYTCSFPIFGLINIISSVPLITRNIAALLVIINVILYTLFAVAFLCRIQTKSIL